MSDWLDPLTSEEVEQLTGRIAEEVARRRMEVPAILFLEMHKPLTFLTSQGLVVGAPLIAPFVGLENVQIASRLLQDRRNVEQLIQRIEELASAGKSAKTAPGN